VEENGVGYGERRAGNDVQGTTCRGEEEEEGKGNDEDERVAREETKEGKGQSNLNYHLENPPEVRSRLIRCNSKLCIQ
jgi:hypothetical protein